MLEALKNDFILHISIFINFLIKLDFLFMLVKKIKKPREKISRGLLLNKVLNKIINQNNLKLRYFH